VGLNHAVYPVGLVVSGKPCLVVGGGRVAGRKVSGLLRCGAAVTMVAPEAHVALRSLADDGTLAAVGCPPLDVQIRPYRPGEAACFRLVVAATGIDAVDQMVHDDAEDAGVWVNCADHSARCSVVLPAVHRDGPVTVAVSTAGASPALASWIRHRVADALGPHLGALADLLDEARQAVHRSGRSTEPIDWAGLLDGPLPDLVRAGRIGEARGMIEAICGVDIGGTSARPPADRPAR